MIRLGEGDLLYVPTKWFEWLVVLQLITLGRIMPPGIPHALYTPVDCLVGGFFSSPPDVSTLLRVLLFFNENPHCTNHDPLCQNWEAHTVCFR